MMSITKENFKETLERLFNEDHNVCSASKMNPKNSNP
jgi:hypothetical protein